MRRHALAALLGLAAAAPSPAVAASPSAPQPVADAVTITPPEQPFFMEPYLLASDQGIVVAAIAKPRPGSGEPVRIDRDGWTCRSDDGTRWACQQVAQPAGIIDFADPWLADSRGSTCGDYDGITMVALQGAFGPRRYLEPVAYSSRDGGRTWHGPVLIPSNDPIADGTKVVFSGRLYAAWRDFAFATGARVSRLGTETEPCRWSEPRVIADGHDHPRLAPGLEPGGLAYRGSLGTTALTFERYDPDGIPGQAPAVIGETAPLSVLTQLCDDADGHCFAAYDVGQTLVKGAGYEYFAAWLDRPALAGAADRRHTVVRFSHSIDGGRTWSAPQVVAGFGAAGSPPGAAAWMPQLSYDESTRTLALGYVERDYPDDREASVRLRIWRDDAWSPAAEVGTTLTWTSTGTDRHLGDYFGLQATGGMFHVAWQQVTDEAGLARLRYRRLELAP